jgi:hypothetical protein
MNVWLAGLVYLTAAGCTFDDGAWFAELQPQLAASYQPAADRSVDGRYQRLASGYEVALDRAELTVGALDLIAADSGSDGGGAAPVLSLPGGSFNLLAPRPIPLACTGGCRLDRTRIVRMDAKLTSVHLEGAVRSGPGAPQGLGERRFSVDLPAAGAPIGPLAGPLDLPADNRHPPRVDLQVAIALGPELFDHLDWVSFPDQPGQKLLADTITKIPLDARLRR